MLSKADAYQRTDFSLLLSEDPEGVRDWAQHLENHW